MRLVEWITRMNSDNLKDGNHILGDNKFLTTRTRLVTSGIKLATEIKRALKQYLLLHEINDSTVASEKFELIVQAIEMLKAIEIEFKTKKFLINKWVVLINRQTCENITILLEQGL